MKVNKNKNKRVLDINKPPVSSTKPEAGEERASRTATWGYGGAYVYVKAVLFLFFILHATIVIAGTNSYGTAGTYTNLNSLPDLSRFLGIGNAPASGSHGEDANRYKEIIGQGTVYSGGLHSTSASCVAASIDTVAYTESGNRLSKTGTAIDYSAYGCNCANPGTDVATVIASGLQSTSQGNFTRVTGTPYFVNCTDAAGVTIPADSTPLMEVHITNGQIASVLDLRQKPWYELTDHVDNTHGEATLFGEMRQTFGDVLQPYILSSCSPAVPTTSLTLGAFSCNAYVDSSDGRLVYVQQSAVTLTLANVNDIHWIAVCEDTFSSVSGWTRRAGSHYVFRQVTLSPANPAGCLVVASVTVAGSVITAVDRAPQVARSGIEGLTGRSGITGMICDDATDNTAVIQAALDSLPSAGGILMLPPGVCRHGDITVTKTVRLLGAGYQRTTMKYTGTATAWYVTGHHVYFEDMSFTPVSTTAASIEGIRFENTVHGGLIRARVYDFKGTAPDYGIGVRCHAPGTGNKRCYWLHIERSIIDANGDGLSFTLVDSNFPPTFPYVLASEMTSNLRDGIVTDSNVIGATFIGGQSSYNGRYGANWRGETTTFIGMHMEDNVTKGLFLRDPGLGGSMTAFINGLIPADMTVQTGQGVYGTWNILGVRSMYVYGTFTMMDGSVHVVNDQGVKSDVSGTTRNIIQRTNSTEVSVGDTAGITRIGFYAGGSIGVFIQNGKTFYTGMTFASLGTPTNGNFTYCTDCTIANPCAGSGTGAFAKRLNGAWVCN